MISCDLLCGLMGLIMFLEDCRLISFCFSATNRSQKQNSLLLAEQQLNHNMQMEKKLPIKKCSSQTERWEKGQSPKSGTKKHSKGGIL